MPPLARDFGNLTFRGLVYEKMATGLTAPPSPHVHCRSGSPSRVRSGEVDNPVRSL
jgi:hypothetical protein